MRKVIRFDVPCQVELNTETEEVKLLVNADDWVQYARESLGDLTIEEAEFIGESGLPAENLTIGFL